MTDEEELIRRADFIITIEGGLISSIKSVSVDNSKAIFSVIDKDLPDLEYESIVSELEVNEVANIEEILQDIEEHLDY